MKRLQRKNFQEKFHQGESAMEYLMTYGWAILIIAVVLGALFELGVFSSASLLGTSCVAVSGFLCSKPVLSGSSLTLTSGQYTGTNWNTATFCIVPSVSFGSVQ